MQLCTRQSSSYKWQASWHRYCSIHHSYQGCTYINVQHHSCYQYCWTKTVTFAPPPTSITYAISSPTSFTPWEPQQQQYSRRQHTCDINITHSCYHPYNTQHHSCHLNNNIASLMHQYLTHINIKHTIYIKIVLLQKWVCLMDSHLWPLACRFL